MEGRYLELTGSPSWGTGMSSTGETLPLELSRNKLNYAETYCVI